MDRIDPESLRVICGATVHLTKLRQNECKHLCIENIAPDMFGSMLAAYYRALLENQADRVTFEPASDNDIRESLAIQAEFRERVRGESDGIGKLGE